MKLLLFGFKTGQKVIFRANFVCLKTFFFRATQSQRGCGKSFFLLFFDGDLKGGCGRFFFDGDLKGAAGSFFISFLRGLQKGVCGGSEGEGAGPEKLTINFTWPYGFRNLTSSLLSHIDPQC